MAPSVKTHHQRSIRPAHPLTHQQDNKSLKDIAKENPTQIGDPVSLKAETADSKPTPDDTGAKGDGEKQTLKQKAEEKLKSNNPTMLGDPVSLKAETSDTEPTADDRGALGTSKSSGQPKM
jgi:hypothetical protein